MMKIILNTFLAVSFAVPVVALNCRADEQSKPAVVSASIGRSLFLKNCAECHAEDATGDEGPDLHGLKKSSAWISRRIRNGVKGEMTAFGEKFSQRDIDSIIAYLRTLK